MTDCAAKIHCSVDTVKKVLTINNIPIRPLTKKVK